MSMKIIERSGRYAASLLAIVQVLLAALQSFAADDGGEPDGKARTTWPAMGTLATLTVAGDDRPRLAEYAEAARKIVAGLEASLSIFNPSSEISLVNQSAGKTPVPVSRNTLEILEMSRKFSELSGGRFDVTVGPLVKAWGFAGGKRPDKPLDEATIREIMKSVGYRHIIVSNATVMLDVPGASINLGGIAKGYAIDACYNELAGRLKARNFMMDLGGNIRCGGTGPGGKPWTIGVRNPFAKDGIVGTLALTNGMAVGTSGNYEQFFMIGDKRYTHIIDPGTGCPVSGMASVTVISTTAVETEGLSKPLFMMGPTNSANLLSRTPGSQAIFIPDGPDGWIYVTPGLKTFNAEPDLLRRVAVIGESQ